MIRTPEEWLEIYRKGGGLVLANAVLNVLDDYDDTSHNIHRTHDLHQLLNVFTAMQLDGIGRVGSKVRQVERQPFEFDSEAD